MLRHVHPRPEMLVRSIDKHACTCMLAHTEISFEYHTTNGRACSIAVVILKEYQWARVPAFERGNVATVVLVQNILSTKAFDS